MHTENNILFFGGTLVEPLSLGGLTNRDKNMFFIFVKNIIKY